MNYVYTYVEDEQEAVRMRQAQAELQKRQQAVCYFDYGSTKQWEQLQAVWKQSDTLFIYDIAHLASEVLELKQRLRELQSSGLCVRLSDERTVDLEQMLLMIDFVTGTIRKRNYALQLEGIHRALEKKKNGEGSYGRPKMVLPDDFEENIRKIMRKEMKHEDYQKQLGFKRSTYFKMVKELRDGWKAQDEENETAALTQE